MNQTKIRLLHLLNEFGEYLENAWDVPRSISLPGLADSMNMVRSGLHKPLKQLEEKGLVKKRLAHVIGGGTRKRQVFHITNDGRSAIESRLVQPPSVLSEEKKPSANTHVYGRDDFITTCLNHLDQHSTLAIGGLSGIGKSTVADIVTETLESNHFMIRKVNVLEENDANSLLSIFHSETEHLPSSNDGIREYILSVEGKNVYVFDDFHCLSDRHLASVFSLIDACTSKDGNVVILIGKQPMNTPEEFETFILESLEISDAIKLLDNEISVEERTQIATSLGGHPFAILLYDQRFELPEQQGDVQSFVENSVLSGFSSEESHLIAMLSLLLKPIEVKHSPYPELVANLDEAALLKWSKNEMTFELHHFIRNVRKAMLTEEQLKQLHEEYLEHWKTMNSSDDIDMFRLYHLLSCSKPNDIGRVLEEYFDALIVHQSSQLASLLASSLSRNPEHEELNYYAALTALQRNELDEVESNFRYIKGEMRDDVEYQLLLQRGKQTEAEKILQKRIGNEQSIHVKNRMLLSGIIQRLEDRLFDTNEEPNFQQIERLLDGIELPEDPQKRAATLVSISMIKHAIEIYRKDYSKAENIRNQLISLSHGNNILVKSMLFRSQLAKAEKNEGQEVLYDCIEFVDQLTHSQHRLGFLMSIAEYAFVFEFEKLDALIERCKQEVDGIQSLFAHRILGRWWYLQSKVNTSRRLISLKESSIHFRISGCMNNVNKIQTLLHRLL
jgi:DNA-binding MarR family transcriptional regulator